jgi:hypothetical protein
MRGSARRLGLVTAIALAVAGLAASVAQACNTGWQRTPDDGAHYWAGVEDNNMPHVPATCGNGCTTNGVTANLYVTNPTLRDSTHGAGHKFSSAWVGINGLDQNNVFVLLQTGYVKTGAQPNDCTFYQVNNGTVLYDIQCPTQGSNLLTVGSTYEFLVDYLLNSNTAHFEFAGVDRFDPDLGMLGEQFTSNTLWFPSALGEIGSYNEQIPGTQSNTQLFNNMGERWGSGTWDFSADQNWAAVRTKGSASTRTQTQVNNSFFAGGALHVNNPVGQEFDWCTSS